MLELMRTTYLTSYGLSRAWGKLSALRDSCQGLRVIYHHVSDEMIKVVKGENSLVKDYVAAISNLPYSARVIGFIFSLEA
jgi:hypothetical protein